MSEITIELVGRGTRWTFAKREIRVGRDNNCDVILAADEYPMVSRNHLLLRLEGERCWVEDLKTSGGTFLNGKLVQGAPVSPGDQLRLSADGPVLRLFYSALAIPPNPQSAAARLSSIEEDPTRIASPNEPAPSLKAPMPHGPERRTQSHPTGETPWYSGMEEGRAQDQPRRSQGSRTDAGALAPSMAETLSKRDTMLMEQKLSSIRNLLVVMSVLIVVMAGMLVYQDRQIERNRQELRDIRRDAVEMLMPALNQKLKDLEMRLDKSQAAFDGIDGKLNDAQDRFMKQITTGLPAILDKEVPIILNKYIDQKLQDLQRTRPNRQP